MIELVCNLFKDAFSVTFIRLYSVEWKGDRWMMNWKGCGRKQSLPNFNVLSRHLSEDDDRVQRVIRSFFTPCKTDKINVLLEDAI
jgi:hypothetical protein